ncbi:MAG: AAA family ATPase [Rhodopseudomonas sp.]|nr:AAA family ATPase [Rhodopseudomonas sp.]
MAALVKNFQSLHRAGVFAEYTHTADVPDFRRFNLIYGFNGCGKTTLSRILRSIEQGAKSALLPEDCEFSICCTEGPDFTDASCNGVKNPTIVVFNEDFIEENLRWREGQASPVYFIGQEQARLSEYVDRATERLDRRKRAQQTAETQQASLTSELTEFKRDLARLIANELNLGRRYVATQLEHDYSSINLAAQQPLGDAQIKAKKELINRTSAASTVAPIEGLPVELSAYFGQIKAVCMECFAAAALDELKQHAEMLKWVKEGLDYHTSHSMENCLFCGNNFTGERADALRASIDARFEKTIEMVQSLHEARAEYFDEIDKFQLRLPAAVALDASVADKYGAAREQLIACTSALHMILTQVRGPLDAKLRAPNIAIDVSLIDLVEARRQETLLHDLIEQANTHIEAHNEKASRFEQKSRGRGCTQNSPPTGRQSAL